jgi:hypothetical protein
MAVSLGENSKFTAHPRYLHLSRWLGSLLAQRKLWTERQLARLTSERRER